MSQEIIVVKNTEGDPDTKAKILIKNKIDYTPKVSVIIPVYNTEKYLKECLDSVINQSLKEIEIICVDDGSTDNSLEILKEYAAKDNRITVLAQENLYAGVARNAGMMVASGEYYHFLDSDDFVEDNIYEKCVENNKNYDIIIFANNVIDENTQELIRVNKASIDEKNKNFIQTNPNAWSKLFNKCFIQSRRIKFEGLKIANDLTFTYTALALADNIKYIDIPLISYRGNQKHNLTANRGDNIECFFKAIQKLKNNLKIYNVFHKYNNTFYDRIKASLNYELKFYKHTYDELRQVMFKTLDNELYKLLICDLKPKISIIIAAYNAEKYLKQCLDSVTNQSLIDIEIICVNDGSSDNSLAILYEYARLDTRIKIINQENQGLSISRNNALKIAKGKYIQFVDADDYINLKACERIYLQAIQNDLDILMIGGNNFDNYGNITESAYNSFLYLPNNFKEVFNYIDCKDFITRIAVSSCLNIYKNDFLNAKKIKWIGKKICYEDNLFFTEALFKANRIGVCKEKLYFRRIHNESITQNIEKNFKDKIEINTRLFEMLFKITSKEYLDLYIKSRLNILYSDYIKIGNEKYMSDLSNLVNLIFKKYNYSIPNIMQFLLNKEEYYFKYLKSSRIDIKNYGSKDNEINIIENITNVRAISTKKSNGFSLTCKTNSFCFRAIKSGKLIIDLFNTKEDITYKSIKLNGKNLLKSSLILRSGDEYRIKKRIWDGKQYKLEFDCIKNSEIKLDIRNVRTNSNNIELIDSLINTSIKTPIWFIDSKGSGCVLENCNFKDYFKVQIVNDGELMLRFMGVDAKFNNERIPLYVNYQSIKINGKEILSNPIVVWHDKVFVYKKKVKNKEVIEIETTKKYYKYSKKELNNIVSKLINNDADKLIIDKVIKIYEKEQGKEESIISRIKEFFKMINFNLRKKNDSKRIAK
ncbi:glycosyltransferase, family 2 [Campylobacter sp. RM5004]|uniref:glycosyltransferase n=1 Tax=Campylobacter sp. RM5004 TaxID=1660078 RepID=UPI001EFA74F5|nr:glycosyltransferase [Campylobacter sp. RM5004]ULO01692.1 glycosyltransferase, family 2 [Campylobacter sp. RM5004]